MKTGGVFNPLLGCIEHLGLKLFASHKWSCLQRDILDLSWTLWCTSGDTAPAPCETPLMEKNASKPPSAEQPPPPNPQPQAPPAESEKVAFKLGGSEEADLDNNDMETKDLDIGNGEIRLDWNKSPYLCFIWQWNFRYISACGCIRGDIPHQLH